MRAVRHALEYSGLAAYSAFAGALPRTWALALGRGVGDLGWLLRLRRNVVLENLERVFPTATHQEKTALGRASCRNFARSATEFARFGTDRPEVKNLVEVRGLELLRAECERAPGAVVVTGHLGAWALYVTALAAQGQPTSLLVGKQSNARVDQFIHDLPGEAVELIGKGPLAPRGVLRGLAAGRCVLMVADQHSRVGIEVPFLGHVCKTLALPGAILAKKQRPLFLLEGFHVEGGHHLVDLSPISLPDLCDCDLAERARIITTLCNEAIGEAVRRHPDQYFWHHRRWRRSDQDQAAGE